MAGAHAELGGVVGDAVATRVVAIHEPPEALDGGVRRRRGRGPVALRVPAVEQDQELVEHRAQRVGRVVAQRGDLALHRAEARQEHPLLGAREPERGARPAFAEEGELVEEAHVGERLGHELLGEEQAGAVETRHVPRSQLAGAREQHHPRGDAAGLVVQPEDPAPARDQQDVVEAQHVRVLDLQEAGHGPDECGVEQQLAPVLRAVELDGVRRPWPGRGLAIFEKYQPGIGASILGGAAAG